MGVSAYGSVGSLEHLQLGQGLALEDSLGDGTGGNEALEGGDGEIPQALVLLLQEDNQAGGLGVERAGNVQDSLVDDLFDLRVRDGGILAELVDGATVLSRLDESFGGHFG